MRSFSFTLCFFIFSLTTRAEIFSAEIFRKGSDLKDLIFRFQVETKEEGPLSRITTIYQDPKGDTVLVEQDVLKDELSLVSMELQQNQMKQSAKIYFEDKNLVFQKVVDGKEETSKESPKGPIVLAGNFQRFVRKHWSELQSGKSIEFRWAAWERKETVGFEIFKVGEESFQGQNIVKLKMKPSSFVIAAIVDPIFFKFKADGSRLMSLSGRVAVKQNVNSKWKDLDADVVYKYPENTEH